VPTVLLAQIAFANRVSLLGFYKNHPGRSGSTVNGVPTASAASEEPLTARENARWRRVRREVRRGGPPLVYGAPTAGERSESGGCEGAHEHGG
jgi:hypothetical protein